MQNFLESLKQFQCWQVWRKLVRSIGNIAEFMLRFTHLLHHWFAGNFPLFEMTDLMLLVEIAFLNLLIVISFVEFLSDSVRLWHQWDGPDNLHWGRMQLWSAYWAVQLCHANHCWENLWPLRQGWWRQVCLFAIVTLTVIYTVLFLRSLFFVVWYYLFIIHFFDTVIVCWFVCLSICS